MNALGNLWLAPLAPLLYLQGRMVRASMPALPEASGPRVGLVSGSRPALRLLFLGESTIVGVGVVRMQDALPAGTARELAARTSRETHWQALGISGGVVADMQPLTTSLTQDSSRTPFTCAVIALGVSDCISFTTPRDFLRSMNHLLAGVRQRLGPLPVLLSGVPRIDGFRTPLPQPLRLALALRCRSLERMLTRVSQENDQVLHWPVFLPPGTSNAPQAFAQDGFHPGKAGYRLWSRHLALGVQTLLEGADSGL